MGGSSKDKSHSSNKGSSSKTSSNRTSSSKHSKSKQTSDRNSNGEGSSRQAQDEIAELPENEQEQRPASGYWETRKICCNCQQGTDLKIDFHFACFFCNHQIGAHCKDTYHWVAFMENEAPLNYDPLQDNTAQQSSYHYQE